VTQRTFGIGLYAPAGFVTNPAAIDRAVHLLSELGHRVVVDPTCSARWQRFSATDDERVAAVLRMAADPQVELAIAARGGYGWSRLLDRIDFPALAQARKLWMGHSDFTAFQLAALAHAGMTTFAGPMAAYDFGAAIPSAFTLDHCWGLLGATRYEVECALEGPDFAGEGTLWGGNLAMVAHLAGTPHMPRVDEGILFLEDISEHPYRIERMIYQLHHAGCSCASVPCCSATSATTSSVRTTTATMRRRWLRTSARGSRFRCTPDSRSGTARKSSRCRWAAAARSAFAMVRRGSC
jgi:muramoyltetrapeptide carboxypeptidase